jgi:glycosyltransferase involved in cell wall biosynthesis
MAGYLRSFHNRTACTLVPTDTVKAALDRSGVHRVGILARGVDTELFRPEQRSDALRRQWGVTGTAPVFLTVGRLAAEKNLDLAIRGFEAVRAVVPDARLVLVGDGPDRQRLEAMAPEGVIFAGMRRGDDLARHYASADVFAFPSLTETFGNVLLEGMASGLPGVAFHYAAAATHLQSGVNGLAVPFGDDQAFISALITMAQTSVDQRRMYADSALQIAAALGWAAVVERFEQVLVGVCENVIPADRPHRACGEQARKASIA